MRRGGDAWRDGDSTGCVLVSEHAHYCVERAVRIMGLGKAGIVSVPCDEGFRMRPEALADALATARAAGREPFAVIASACNTAMGSFDPIAKIADFCAAHDLWLHVDGAHGASLVFSDTQRHRMAGIERADSVVWDLHKTMMMPALSTAVIYRDERHAAAAFQQDASYVFDGDAWSNTGQRTIECTKRAIGMVAWMGLTSLGTDALGRYQDQLTAVARSFAQAVADADDFELLMEPDFDIVCFRYRPTGGPSDAPTDRTALNDLQRRTRAAVIQDGRYYITQTLLHRPDDPGPTHWLRITVLSPFTEPEDAIGVLRCVRNRGT